MLGEPVKNKSGGNQVFMTFVNKQKIYVQTPIMNTPFGVSEYAIEGTNTVKYSLDLSFKGYDEDVKIEKFMKVIQDLDNFMITTGVQRSMEWFGKQMSYDVVNELYRPLLKISKDPEKYAPTLKTKIRTNLNNDFMFSSYHNKEIFDMDDFKAGSKVRMIFEFAPIWFVNKQFGLTPYISQVDIVEMPANTLNGFSFEEDDS
jgi:hypothetical protein